MCDDVLMSCNSDEQTPTRLHLQTRGLRKFARPYLDVHQDPAVVGNDGGELLQRQAQC